MKRSLINSFVAELTAFILKKNPPAKGIYLFGSFARGDFGPESDVDIFINTEEKDAARVKKVARRALARLKKAPVFTKYELEGVDKHNVNFTVGNIEKFDLKESISAEGIIFYGPPLGLKPNKALFVITPPKSKAKYMKVRRELFGRKEKKYHGRGLIKSSGGKELTSRVFVVPKTKQKKVLDFLRKEKVKYKLFNVFE